MQIYDENMILYYRNYINGQTTQLLESCINILGLPLSFDGDFLTKVYLPLLFGNKVDIIKNSAIIVNDGKINRIIYNKDPVNNNQKLYEYFPNPRIKVIEIALKNLAVVDFALNSQVNKTSYLINKTKGVSDLSAQGQLSFDEIEDTTQAFSNSIPDKASTNGTIITIDSESDLHFLSLNKDLIDVRDSFERSVLVAFGLPDNFTTTIRSISGLESRIRSIEVTKLVHNCYISIFKPLLSILLDESGLDIKILENDLIREQELILDISMLTSMGIQLNEVNTGYMTSYLSKKYGDIFGNNNNIDKKRGSDDNNRKSTKINKRNFRR
jgi:hypothetical protein